MKGSTIIKNKILGLWPLLVLAFIWKLFSLKIGMDIILPSPEKVFMNLVEIIKDELFLKTIFASLSRGIKGFSISFVIALLIAVLAGISKNVRDFMQPIIIILRATPLLAVILLALIWFPKEVVAIFVCFHVVFPIIYTNVLEGMKNIDEQLLEMADLFQISLKRKILEIYLPGIMPYMIAGISTALGMTWKAVISAEVLSQPMFGIGTNIEVAKSYLETPMVFAWTSIAIFMSFFSESILRNLQNKLIKWK